MFIVTTCSTARSTARRHTHTHTHCIHTHTHTFIYIHGYYLQHCWKHGPPSSAANPISIYLSIYIYIHLHTHTHTHTHTHICTYILPAALLEARPSVVLSESLGPRLGSVWARVLSNPLAGTTAVVVAHTPVVLGRRGGRLIRGGGTRRFTSVGLLSKGV